MKDYRYFMQEGGEFHLKTRMSTAVIRSVACLMIGAAQYYIIPPEKKSGFGLPYYLYSLHW
ncbi:hypothetical protein [Chryseobacterium populi]|uniref:Uncharacterized protein n=1 Tax=Chryseobacterium populi TaxID=1144316 RepID=J2JK75_9FLAO|nr:hypothetical protein [Chryseobacterium populi]EJL68295.1 hypothetical protein PMI13_03823 [Chryseobacterium populi]